MPRSHFQGAGDGSVACTDDVYDHYTISQAGSVPPTATSSDRHASSSSFKIESRDPHDWSSRHADRTQSAAASSACPPMTSCDTPTCSSPPPISPRSSPDNYKRRRMNEHEDRPRPRSRDTVVVPQPYHDPRYNPHAYSSGSHYHPPSHYTYFGYDYDYFGPYQQQRHHDTNGHRNCAEGTSRGQDGRAAMNVYERDANAARSSDAYERERRHNDRGQHLRSRHEHDSRAASHSRHHHSGGGPSSSYKGRATSRRDSPRDSPTSPTGALLPRPPPPPSSSGRMLVPLARVPPAWLSQATDLELWRTVRKQTFRAGLKEDQLAYKLMLQLVISPTAGMPMPALAALRGVLDEVPHLVRSGDTPFAPLQALPTALQHLFSAAPSETFRAAAVDTSLAAVSPGAGSFGRTRFARWRNAGGSGRGSGEDGGAGGGGEGQGDVTDVDEGSAGKEAGRAAVLLLTDNVKYSFEDFSASSNGHTMRMWRGRTSVGAHPRVFQSRSLFDDVVITDAVYTSIRKRLNPNYQPPL